MIKHTWNQLSEATKKKFSKDHFKSLSNKEKEFLSMGATMFSGAGPVIEPKNLHLLTPKGLSITLKKMEKEKRNLDSEGKKLLKSVTKKLSSIVEQASSYSELPPGAGNSEDDDEEEKLRKMAQRIAKLSGKNFPKELEPEEDNIRPLETGQPGAMSMDIGWEKLASMRRPDDEEEELSSATMEDQPGMPGRPPPPYSEEPPMRRPERDEDIDRAKKIAQNPEAMKKVQQMMDSNPELKKKAESMMADPEMRKKIQASLGGFAGLDKKKLGFGEKPLSPEEEEEKKGGPREMSPADDFGARMGIRPITRQAVQSYEDEKDKDLQGRPVDKPEEQQAGFPPGQQQQQGQPGAKKSPPPKKNPGTTQGSKAFIAKYGPMIKSFLKTILDKEKEKFQMSDLGEQAGNAVGNGMSPTQGEGPIAGNDSHLFRRGKKKKCKKCNCGK